MPGLGSSPDPASGSARVGLGRLSDVSEPHVLRRNLEGLGWVGTINTWVTSLKALLLSVELCVQGRIDGELAR